MNLFNFDNISVAFVEDIVINIAPSSYSGSSGEK